MNSESKTDLIVFSLDTFNAHKLRTSTVVTNLAQKRRVYYIETPVTGVSTFATYFLQKNDDDITVVKPYLPGDISVFEQKALLQDILHELMEEENITHYSIWTDTPRAMPFIRDLTPEYLIYDCLVDHSQTHPALEREMFKRAHVVITSGLQEKNQMAFHRGFFGEVKSPAPDLVWN